MQAKQKYSFTHKYRIDYKVIPLLAVSLLLFVTSSCAALALSTNKKAEAKKLFKLAIRQLNSTNGNNDQFNNYFNRIVTLTKFDYDLQQQILADSFSEVKILLKDKEYTKAQELLSFDLRLDPSEDAIKIMIALKAKVGKFDDIEPTVVQYFNLSSNSQKSWWHFNLDKAEILTYAAKVCEEYSSAEQAEHFYRLAIQQTSQPVRSLGLDEWDNIAARCYYWARMYDQACLGQLLVNNGGKNTGISVLSTIKNNLEHDHPLTPNTNPGSKSYQNNWIAWRFELEWKKDRDKTYATLGMIPKDSPII